MKYGHTRIIKKPKIKQKTSQKNFNYKNMIVILKKDLFLKEILLSFTLNTGSKIIIEVVKLINKWPNDYCSG